MGLKKISIIDCIYSRDSMYFVSLRFYAANLTPIIDASNDGPLQH
jgi:hypothetical protein